MKAKLKVEITIRIDEEGDLSIDGIKDKIRDYCKENKFQINNVTFKADYTGEQKEED